MTHLLEGAQDITQQFRSSQNTNKQPVDIDQRDVPVTDSFSEASHNGGNQPSVLGGGSPEQSLSYERELIVWLENHKRYPSIARSRGQQGVVEINFRIDADGQLLDFEITAPSRYRSLNNAVAQMLERASPMPHIPETYVKTKTLTHLVSRLAFLYNEKILGIYRVLNLSIIV